jgi:hypothetical protein
MSILNDIWGNEVIVTKDYVSHRNRLIDVHLIQTFQAKGKRVYINTFKQNTSVPTMCVFFESKEKAQDAYTLMRDVYYGPLVLEKATQPQLSTSQMLSIFFVTFGAPLVFLLLLLLRLPVTHASPLFLSS